MERFEYGRYDLVKYKGITGATRGLGCDLALAFLGLRSAVMISERALE
jgi:hypothetical protein